MTRRHLLAVSSAVGLGTACRAQPQAFGPVVSISAYGAVGDGRADDTAAFQRACDALREGGTITVGPGRFAISSVAIRHRFITIALAPETVLVKRGPLGIDQRGMFVIDGLGDANFLLAGGAIDLSGQGPRQINNPRLLPNAYAALTIPMVIGIAGPPNAAVFARRSSAIRIERCTITNSGENGLLFRNCGQITVADCRFDNIANYGIEFSFVRGDGDGGSGPMPRRDDVTITGCRFDNIDDYALGSGNGGGIGGGGGADLGTFRNYRIADCIFRHCHRDIHFEFERGSGMENVEISRLRSTEPRQGSIGLVAVRKAVLRDIDIDRPGSAPTALLIPARPELFGIVLSSGFADILIDDVHVIDDRPGRLFATVGGTIEQGSRRLRSARPVFETADVGTWAGIARGNPAGCAYVGRIAEVLSPREALLDLAAGARVAGGQFAVGGRSRNGLILTAGRDVTIRNSSFCAGSMGEPADAALAAAIRLWGMGGTVAFDGVALSAPRGAQGKPAAIKVSRSDARLVRIDQVEARGFARRLVE